MDSKHWLAKESKKEIHQQYSLLYLTRSADKKKMIWIILYWLTQLTVNPVVYNITGKPINLQYTTKGSDSQLAGGKPVGHVQLQQSS